MARLSIFKLFNNGILFGLNPKTITNDCISIDTKLGILAGPKDPVPIEERFGKDIAVNAVNPVGENVPPID